MDSYTEQWRQIFARRKTGRRLMLLHLVIFPVAIYLAGYLLTIATDKAANGSVHDLPGSRVVGRGD